MNNAMNPLKSFSEQPWKFIRLLSCFILLGVSFPPLVFANISNSALPPCQEIDGEEVGACPDVESDLVSGTIGGNFSAGATVQVITTPEPGICIKHNGNTGIWEPSPCFAGISSPSVSATCAFVDLSDGGKFKEMSCRDALYTDNTPVTGSLFNVEDENGNRCGGSGNFVTFIYGGAANVAGARWSEFGPAKQFCNITFNGPRPDGLFGPTWAKVTVGASIANTGDGRTPDTFAAQQMFVPIEGDLRPGTVDVGIFSAISDQSYDDVSGVHRASIEFIVENFGSDPVDNFDIIINVPNHVHVEAISDDRCLESGITTSFIGARVTCRGISLAESDDPLDRNIEFFDIDLRVTNSAELEGDILFSLAGVQDDENLSNNESLNRIRVELLETGSVADTHALLDALEPFFDYEVSSDDLLNRQCNEYMDDIYDRLYALQSVQPGLFQNLSFGKVSSGDYLVFTGMELGAVDPTILSAGNIDRFRAGHVGVVAYLKGTDFRRTGVVIHGTPTWSPTDIDTESKYGTEDFGDQLSPFGIIGTLGITGALNPLNQGTQDHGRYYRTPVQNFPGSARSESRGGCGFEGVYADNQDEFLGNIPNCVITNAGDAITGQSCNISTSSTILRTQSPVDIIAKNASGDTIRTLGSEIYIDEYYQGRIFAWAEPHEDGSHAWLITLPDDGYQVELTGNGDGDYVFTTVTFDDESNATFEETRDTTSMGLIEAFDVGDVEDFQNASSTGSGGGGGALIVKSAWEGLLLLLFIILFWLHKNDHWSKHRDS